MGGTRRSWIWLAVLLATALAAPLGASPKKTDPHQKRIELLEKQVRMQSRQLEQMQKELQELRRQREETAPAPAPSVAPAPSPESPVIDDSVPPPSPTPGTESTPQESPTPEGPIIDESVPPPATAPPTRPGGTPDSTSVPQTSTGAISPSFMNPAISAIGLFEARTSSDKSNRSNNQFAVREVEIAMQGVVDPYARYDIFLTAGNNQSVSIEEAYGTIFNLPLGFLGKVGKYKATFGRNNSLHTHELPQIDRPEVISQFFGEEGMSGPGVSVSNILPTPWYSEVFLQAFSSDDNPALFSSEVSQKPIYNVSWRNLFDLREDLTLEAGLSGAYGKTDTSELKDTKVAGAHLTLKYRPLRQLGQFGITWESEYLTETQRVPFLFQGPPDANGVLPSPETRITNRSANGWYSYVDVQANRNWFLGLRYDWTRLPIDPSKIVNGWTPYLGYRFSEYNSLRLQYKNVQRNWGKALQEVFLQWNIVIGPHGVHKY